MDNQIRILAVDDKTKWKDDFRQNLGRWGYLPVIAEGSGDELIGDAKEKANQHCCHIVLLDMDLFDRRGEDRSGLKLIPELKPATSIIVTGYPSHEAMREAFKSQGAYEFIGKDEGPRALQLVIRDAIEETWPCLIKEPNVGIVWNRPLTAEILTENFRRKAENIHDDELNLCLLKHFKDAIQINLELVANRFTSDTIAPGPRLSGTVFKVQTYNKSDGDPVEQFPTLVKFARRIRIDQEINNFNKYIKGKMPPRTVANLKGYFQMWHVGLIEYDYLNQRGNLDAMGSLSDEYRTTPKENVVSILFSLFKDALSILYSDQKARTNTLIEAYSNVWYSGTNETDFITELGNDSNQDDEIYLGSFNGSVPNSVRWIQTHLEEMPHRLRPKLAITHGDLHADNILIDVAGNPNLIDFERTGYGPILQDFVLLETDILLRLSTDITDGEFLKLLISLLVALDDFEDNYPSTDPGATKTRFVIGAWRGMARTLNIDNFIESYLWGLLFNNAFRAMLLKKKAANVIDDEKKKQLEKELERAQLYGGLICLRLEKNGEQWLPLEISKKIG